MGGDFPPNEEEDDDATTEELGKQLADLNEAMKKLKGALQEIEASGLDIFEQEGQKESGLLSRTWRGLRSLWKSPSRK